MFRTTSFTIKDNVTYWHPPARKARNLTQRLSLTEKTALTLMGQAYDLMENSWLTLGETSRQFLEGGKLASEVVRSMESLQSKNTVPEHVLVG